MNGSIGNLYRMALWSLGGLALAGGTGLAFAGWIDHGPRLLMALAETGLAWCF